MLWGSAVAPPSFRPPQGGGPHGSSGVVVLSPRRWPAGGSGGNYKSRHASRRRASRRFPVADAREQVVVFMRRHWRLEPGRRHGDSRRGRAEEALPSGRFPGGAGPEDGAAADCSSCLRGQRREAVFWRSSRARATSRGGRDPAGVRRGLAGCSTPASSELGALGFGCGRIHMLEVPRASPCGRPQVPGVRNRKVPACSRETGSSSAPKPSCPATPPFLFLFFTLPVRALPGVGQARGLVRSSSCEYAVHIYLSLVPTLPGAALEF